MAEFIITLRQTGATRDVSFADKNNKRSTGTRKMVERYVPLK
jgi:hypothetical protein